LHSFSKSFGVKRIASIFQHAQTRRFHLTVAAVPPGYITTFHYSLANVSAGSTQRKFAKGTAARALKNLAVTKTFGGVRMSGDILRGTFERREDW
jgi:hypothetical protein